MNKIYKLTILAGVILPNIALAHEDISHTTETIWQQFFNLEHALLYGLPTLITTTIIYKNKTKIRTKLNQIFIKNKL